MMKLYWSPRSRSFSALWLMEETGQPYERVLTDISKGAQKTPEYLERDGSSLNRLGDSQIGKLLIQHADWEGGQHGWDEPIRTTFVSGW